MKARILASSLLLVVLLSGLILPGMAQEPSPTEQITLHRNSEQEHDQPAPQAAWPGPDGYGYGGYQVPLEWLDITLVGTLIEGLVHDSVQTDLPIGFPFNFYGTDYAFFDVASNGVIGFGLPSEVAGPGQCPMPDPDPPDNLIALLWGDFEPNYDSGGAYYFTFPTCPVGDPVPCLVVEYENWSLDPGDPGDAGTWEVILYANDKILLQFLDLGQGWLPGASSTTGIENANVDAGWGLTYNCYSMGSIWAGLAIRFQLSPVLEGSYKVAPEKLDIGEPLPYTVTIQNSGAGPALDTTMTDPIPVGTTFIEGSLSCTSGTCWHDSGVVTWQGQVDVPPADPVVVSFEVDTSGLSTLDLVVNEATISDPDLPGDPIVLQTTTEAWLDVWLGEEFEGDTFPPPGWVEEHDPAGWAWTNDNPGWSNGTGGSSKFAMIDDESGATTANLWTPPLDIPAADFTFLEYKASFDVVYGSESADVDISLDGGVSWTNLRHWYTSHPGPLTVQIDLTPFSGATGAILRFHFDDGGNDHSWWQVDEVYVLSAEFSPLPDIRVEPGALSATVCPDEVTEQTLNICNDGNAPLAWTLAEVGEQPMRPDASPPNVLLLEADDDEPGNCPIQTLLQAYGDLGAVDLFDARNATPTLDDLTPYDVVLTWSFLVYNYQNPTGVGDVLADYVDSGGKVINLPFSMLYAPGAYEGIQGRFRNESYSAMEATNALDADACLGDYDPGHPIMAGVTDVCELFMLRLVETYLNPGAHEVARWDDGELFVAAKYDASVASISGYVGTNYEWTGQMADVVHNAILWLAESGPPPDIPWLSEDPTAGTVEPFQCEQVSVTFDPTGLDTGTYTGQLAIYSDDPYEPQVDVPVTLEVLPPCGPPIHVHWIDGYFIPDPVEPTILKARVWVADENYTLLPGALVEVSMWAPDGTRVRRSRETRLVGAALFPSRSDISGQWRLCVQNVTLAGYHYDQDQNLITCVRWEY